MIEAFNAWLNVPEDKLKVISRVVSMLHNASLLYVERERPSISDLSYHVIASMTSKMMPSYGEVFQVRPLTALP